MGDNTYNHIFGASDTSGDIVRHPQVADPSPNVPPADLDTLFRRADKATDILRSAIKTNLDSPGISSMSSKTTLRQYLAMPMLCSHSSAKFRFHTIGWS